MRIAQARTFCSLSLMQPVRSRPAAAAQLFFCTCCHSLKTALRLSLADSAFFKVAPALAGAQQDGAGGASNEQWLSLQSGLVENRVRIPFGSSVLEVRVDGAVAAGEGGRDEQLNVTFTECSFALRGKGGGGGSGKSAGQEDDQGAPLRVPLPRPVGSLRTTHCDEDLRVSRGGRGGVFLLRRMRERSGEQSA